MLTNYRLEYADRCIPVASPEQYKINLIQRSEQLIRNMRWKAFFYLFPHKRPAPAEYYGFKSIRGAPSVMAMSDFESRITNLIQGIEFSSRLSPFQRKLKADVNAIKNEPNVIMFADKTENMYKIDKQTYSQVLKKTVEKDYKKANSQTVNTILQQDKNIATRLKISDRVDIPAKKTAYVTIKDHKPTFNQENPLAVPCRLINPYKSNIGRVSKQILSRVNSKLVASLSLNQWQSTGAVLDWFNGVVRSPRNTFITFDVVDFYPSISRNLLNKALAFASNYDDQLTDSDRDIILHTKNTLLYHENEPWQKRRSADPFDITMGSWDGAECCELVGTYLLHSLAPLCEGQIGLYRDDGLCITRKSPRQTEILKKNICEVFEKHDLRVTISANIRIVDFLDVTLNLNDHTYKPYQKPNSTTTYVHINSSHPPSILKNIPIAINKRLNQISSNEDLFNQAAPVFQSALEKSGYNNTLTYNSSTDTGPQQRNKNRKRKIIWFNPPFSSNVNTNVGKQFLRILDQSFPPGHVLHKIFNRSTIKVSYSCMPSMKSIIQSHNSKILNQNPTETQSNAGCSCQDPSECPLDGQCLISNIVYQATVTRADDGSKATYVGLASTTFKERFNNHTSSFRNSTNVTQLSNHIRELKAERVQHEVKWKILKKCSKYNAATKKCQLCTYEKYFIICKSHLATLNKKTELMNTCPHRKRSKLKAYQPP